MSDPLDALLDHAVSVEATKIPTQTMNFQLRRVLDNLGCLVAGTTKLAQARPYRSHGGGAVRLRPR